MSTFTLNSVIEGSTRFVTIQFKDENGDLAAPATLNWTLTDHQGRIINNRNNVSIASPTHTEVVPVYGDDLRCRGTGDRARIFLVEGTYNNQYGSGFPVRASARFDIQNIVSE